MELGTITAKIGSRVVGREMKEWKRRWELSYFGGGGHIYS